MLLLLPLSEGQQAAGMARRSAEDVFAKALARQGLTTLDMFNYRQSSASIIIKIMKNTAVTMKALADTRDFHETTLSYHLRGKGVMYNSTVTKLQASMQQVVDSSALSAHEKLYYHELLDKLPLAVKLERIAVKIQKQIDAGELQSDDFYYTYVEPALVVRSDGLAEAYAYLHPPRVIEDNESKIAVLLQKHVVSVEDIDNYKTNSPSILQKIIKAAGITYGQRSLDAVNLRLTTDMHGSSIISDARVMKLRDLITQELNTQKTTAQYSQEAIMQQIDDVFRDLDQALRVERAARDLYTRSHLLDKVWLPRVERVIAKRDKFSSAPLRYKTSWQEIADYAKSSREIFLAITDTIHAGGWPSLFADRDIRKRVESFMSRGSIISDMSWQKLLHKIKQTLAQPPVPTQITKQASQDKLKPLFTQFTTALRVERALLEMQKDVGNFSQLQQQYIQRGREIRDEHLLPQRFRTSWDNVQAFATSSVAMLEALLDALNVSITEVSRHAEFSPTLISEHLRGIKNTRDDMAHEVSHAFCRVIAKSYLPTVISAKLYAQALILPQLMRVERAAREILKNPELKALLNYEQEKMLRNVLAIRAANLAARNQ